MASTKSLIVTRAMAWIATLLIAISVFAGRHDTLRDFCAGAELGMLLGFCVFSMQIKAVVLRDAPQPSDVQHNPIS